jgi:hypothetical protein
LSLLLIAGGLLGAYYLYTISPLAPAPITIKQKKADPSLIPSDTQVLLHIDNLNSIQVQSQIRNEISKVQAPNTIKEIIPVKTVSDVVMRMSAQAMLDIFDIPAPDILKRSITPYWMLGIYTDNNGQKSLFIVVSNDFFQNAFAGMLQWENVMADDLKQYLYPVSPQGIVNVPIVASSSIIVSTSTSNISSTTATKTASSTASITNTIPAIKEYFTLRGRFQDHIVKNKDVRAFVTDNKDVLFLYSFIDNTKMVITSSEATLAEIITRLEKKAFVR